MKYKRKPLLSNPEDIMQASQITWFRLQYPQYALLLFSIPNGEFRSFTTAKRLKATGVVAGVADLFLSIARHNYNGLYIENKQPKRYQSPKQKTFEKHVTQQNYKYIVIKTIDDFINEINNYIHEQARDD